MKFINVKFTKLNEKLLSEFGKSFLIVVSYIILRLWMYDCCSIIHPNYKNHLSFMH